MYLSGKVSERQDVYFKKVGVLNNAEWVLADNIDTARAKVVMRYNATLYPILTQACEQFEIDRLDLSNRKN